MTKYKRLWISEDFYNYIRTLGDKTIPDARSMSTPYLLYTMLKQYERFKRMR